MSRKCKMPVSITLMEGLFNLPEGVSIVDVLPVADMSDRLVLVLEGPNVPEDKDWVNAVYTKASGTIEFKGWEDAYPVEVLESKSIRAQIIDELLAKLHDSVEYDKLSKEGQGIVRLIADAIFSMK